MVTRRVGQPSQESRWSKSVVSTPSQCVCKHPAVCPETPGRQSAGQTAPVLPDALAECARSRACSPRTVSEWTKVGPVHHARKDECEHRRDRRPKVGSQPCRSRQCSPTPLPSVRGHGHAAPAPFLNGQMSVASTPCQCVCKHRCDRRPKVGSQPCRSRQCSPTPLPSVRRHGHAARTVSEWTNVGLIDAMPICVQASV